MELDIGLVIEYWPLAFTAAILAVFGRVMDRVFTRERAYVFDSKGNRRGKRALWFWMRETLPAHPILAGLLLGLVMPDPQGHDWSRPFIVLYFGGAGVGGLAGWLYLKARAKDFPLPGGSEPPAS